MEKDRLSAVERDSKLLTVKRQCELLSVNRTSVYRDYTPTGPSLETLDVMNRIDEIHTAHPTFGYRKITHLLKAIYSINHKRVYRLMRKMGIMTIFPKPNLSKRFHAQFVRPYLLRKLKITRPNQVWGVDITYVKMAKGFMFLFVIIDWYSRYIVDYELSSTVEKSFVLSCMKRAFSKCIPEIVNSDQGCQFTNPEYIKLLEENGVRISMDGKGQALDNVRTERFFRTIKYDDIYITEYNTPRELRNGINDYIHTYNTYRPHDSLRGDVPHNHYFNIKEQEVA